MFQFEYFFEKSIREFVSMVKIDQKDILVGSKYAFLSLTEAIFQKKNNNAELMRTIFDKKLSDFYETALYQVVKQDKNEIIFELESIDNIKIVKIEQIIYPTNLIHSSTNHCIEVFGLTFVTHLDEINFNNLSISELYQYIWEKYEETKVISRVFVNIECKGFFLLLIIHYYIKPFFFFLF
jgi:hypothetical protein